MIKNNQEIGFIYTNNENIDKIYKNNQVVFEQGFTREDSGSTPLTTSHQAIGKNLKDYKIYGNSIQGGLPSEYQQVEYIESTGTQYIDTEVIPTTNTGININYAYTVVDSSTSAGITGIFQPTHPRTDTLFITTSSGKTNSIICLISRGNSMSTNNTPVKDTVYNAKINWLNDGLLNFNNGQTRGVNGTNEVIGHSIILFGREYIDNFSYTSARIYQTKFSEGNIIIRNFVPCYRKADNVIGLYDLVNNVFYINKGTGDFLKGEDVPSEDNPIEIESVGEKTKNLFDENSIYSDTTKFTINNNVINGTAVSFNQTIYNIPSDLVGKQLTFSAFLKTTTTTNLMVVATINGTNHNGNSINSHENFELSKVTFTPVSTNDSLRISYGSSGSEMIYAKDIQLEEGNATDYEPYGKYKIPVRVTDGTNSNTTNIYLDEPLRKIGDYADYIDFKNQKIIRTIEEKIITGTEAWRDVSVGSKNYYRFNIGNYGYVIASQGLCNNYMRDSITTTTTTVGFNVTNVPSLNKSVIAIRPKNVADYTVTTFKQYLANKYNNGRPIIVYYILTTPTEESITLPTISSAKGITVYYVETSSTPSNMYIKYKGK